MAIHRLGSWAAWLSALGALPLACGSSDDPAGGGGSAAIGGSAATGGHGNGDAGGSGGTDGSGLTGGVEILRDSLGTPHVFAADLPSAMYGLGYATARDRLFQMDVSRRWMRGRLAEWFGQGTGGEHLAKDRHHRVMGFARHAEKVSKQLPADVRAALDAYVAGVNAFIGSDGFELPPAYAIVGASTVEPWTAADSLLVWDRLTALFGANDMQNELEKLAQCRSAEGCAPGCPAVLDESAAHVPNPTLASILPTEPERFEVPVKASHAWVVSGGRSSTGKPVLHSDPQTLVTAPGPWYEAHVSFGDVSARGIGVPGAPGFLIFWNRHIAVGGSAAGGDVSDLFELELSTDGKSYLVDGESHPFVERVETILVKNSAAVEVMAKDTVFGPVVDSLLEGVPPNVSYAQRHVGLWKPNDHSLVGVLRMMQATNLEEYRSAAEHWYAPGVNGIYADVEGHIAYHTLLGIPKRSPHGQYPGQVGRVPNDGSTSKHDWSGPLSASERPHVLDPEAGYLLTANHMVHGGWFPHYTGLAGSGETVRSLRLRYLFGEALHQDGKPWNSLLPSAKLTPADVLAMHHDSGSDVARVFRDALRVLALNGVITQDGTGSRNDLAARTLEALELFQGQLVTADPITPLAAALTDLAHTRLRPPMPGAPPGSPDYGAVICKYGGAQGGLGALLKALDSGDASALDPQLRDYLLDTAQAVWSTAAPPGPPSIWKPQSPEFVIKYQSNFLCLGGPGVCSLSPQHDLVVKLTSNSQATLLSQPGNSYTQHVSLADIESSLAVFPTGASEDPSSPWYDNRVSRWLKQELDPAPLERAAIEKDAVEATQLQYQP